jgi:hypothetical protein
MLHKTTQILTPEHSIVRTSTPILLSARPLLIGRFQRHKSFQKLPFVLKQSANSHLSFIVTDSAKVCYLLHANILSLMHPGSEHVRQCRSLTPLALSNVRSQSQ